ncbi:hypothetical protein SAMN05216226_109122 [Halovenus aranensis]|jgi:hypothetical protein|uniref:Uncharacterized protein n=1 Tax=Halovenus aranensis TaxID=890420 RepID=A0A1G8WP26_9EURY|nr:hypothetical protein [Halovenus aranensis]SDJ79843.1 hypothetical protein SAMN05216226_109122 [Halovenus aranensis]
MTPNVKVRCDYCEKWLVVDGNTEYVACECGAGFAVTVTPIATPRA